MHPTGDENLTEHMGKSSGRGCRLILLPTQLVEISAAQGNGVAVVYNMAIQKVLDLTAYRVAINF